MNFKHPKTKDRIIFILNKTPRLTTKEIYQKLKRGSWNFTYQSVHKNLRELMEDDIISRDSKRYSISKTWLSNIQDLLHEETTKIDRIGRVSILTFRSIADLDSWLFDFGREFDIKSEKEDRVVWVATHYWWPIAYSKDMYDDIKKSRHKSVKIFLSDTKLDRWCARYYRDLGVEVKFRKDKPRYFADYKDTKIEIFLSEEIESRIDKFFNVVDKFDDIDLKRFYRTIINKKSKIKVITDGVSDL